MALRIDAVQQECRTIAQQMRDYAHHLNLSFIVHPSGQHLESLTLAGQELLTHPAGHPALRLLKSSGKSETSAFLGLCLWNEMLFFGLANKQKMMALATINCDEFEHLHDVRAQAWAMAWHALHLAKACRISGVEDNPVRLDLDDVALAHANMKADIFSAAMCAMNGDPLMIRHLAGRRSIEAVQRKTGRKPEYFPFPIAADAMEFAFTEVKEHTPVKRKQIQAALQLADNIGIAYDADTLRQWVNFCKPAQEMAWRGHDKETILGAALTTGHDTHIRAIGLLICEATSIKPASMQQLEDLHSPFADERNNRHLHDSLLESAFDKAVNAGLLKQNGMAFNEAANAQNEKLTNGHILGWCAAALQAAGRAFDGALARGSKNPDQEARREFDGLTVRTSWDSLKEISENIIEQYRQGYVATFSDLIEFCGDRPAFAGISSSIAFTVQDPHYLKKLNIANDFKMPSPQPAPAPKTPSFYASPQMTVPGLGLGTTTATRLPSQKLVTEQETSETS